MKKILLATAAAVIATSSAYAADDCFYVKAQAGLSKFAKLKKTKSKNSGFFGVAAGYHVMDNARVELAFDHFFKPTFKQKATTGDVKVKLGVNTLMINGFVDVFDAGMVKVFAGAGAGIAQIKPKVSGTAITAKMKKKTNLALAGYIGAGYEVADGVNAELTYSYKYMGKITKGSKVSKLKGHNVGVGLRFDI